MKRQNKVKILIITKSLLGLFTRLLGLAFLGSCIFLFTVGIYEIIAEVINNFDSTIFATILSDLTPAFKGPSILNKIKVIALVITGGTFCIIVLALILCLWALLILIFMQIAENIKKQTTIRIGTNVERRNMLG